MAEKKSPSPPSPRDDTLEVPTLVREGALLSKAPSVTTMPAPEEALRVFDEMSGMRTFVGEHSTAGEAPPRETDQGAVPRRGMSAGEVETAAFSAAPRARAGADPDGDDLAAPEEVTYWDAWVIFESCQCPLFGLDAEGRIRTANTATWAFLGGTAKQLMGLRLLDTRLGINFPDLQQELRDCTETGGAVQRLLTFKTDETHTVRFLLWIAPLPFDTPQVTFSGIILPYPSDPG